MMRIHTVKINLINNGAFSQFLRTTIGFLAKNQTTNPLKSITLDNTHLIGEIQFVMTQVLIND